MVHDALTAAARALRRALPDWLAAALAFASAPFPYAAALRGALGVALPLLLGSLTGRPVAAVVVALGAVWALSQDSSDAYPVRVRRLAGTALASALGLLIGQSALRSGYGAGVVVPALGVTALVSGLLGPGGRVWSVASTYLLLGATVGSGIPVPGPWWLPPLELLGGAGFLLGLSSLPWLWRRQAAERAAVRAVYDGAAAALAAAGTDGAEAARRRLTLALNHAHDLLSRHLVQDPGRAGDGTGPPIAAFHTSVRLAEAVTALLWEGRRLPPEVRRVPGRIAGRLLGPPDTGGAAPGRPPAEQGFAAGTPGLRALATVQATAGSDRAPVPATPEVPRRAPPRATRLRFAALLTGCVVAATLLAEALHGPRGYWLPMSVAFIYQPDLGPLFSRALNRCLGTLAGVAVMSLVGVWTDAAYPLIAVVAVGAALMAVGVRYHYAVSTLALTAIVFVFLNFLGDQRALFVTRVEDTAIAAVLVLAAHFVLWPQSWRDRARTQVDRALEATGHYVEQGAYAGPTARHALRRTAYRSLAEARHATAQARAEPHRRGRRPPDWDAVIAQAERACDAVTARVADPGPGPGPGSGPGPGPGPGSGPGTYR